MFDKAKGVLYIPEEIYNYYNNPDSITNNFVRYRYLSAAYVNSYLQTYAMKWNIKNVNKILDSRYFLEICESVRQIKYYNLSIKQKIEYIKEVSNDQYFKSKFSFSRISLSLKRKLFLVCIRFNLWPIIIIALR